MLYLSGAILILLFFYANLKPRMSKTGPFLPDSYLFGIGLYLAGTMVANLSNADPISETLLIMCLVAMASALAGLNLFLLLFAYKYQAVDFVGLFCKVNSGSLERLAINVLLVVSTIVCILFVYAVFSNSIVSALLSIASIFGDSTLNDARKAITAGSEGYLAPGYVKQFRDIIIPIALLALMVIRPGGNRVPVAWFALVAAILAMIVSGQRLVFVVFFLALIIGRSYTIRFEHRRNRVKDNRTRIPWISLVVLFAIYGVFTVILGRTDSETPFVSIAPEIIGNFLDRVFLAAPRENLLSAPVWQQLGPTFGGSWIADLSGVLPGVDTSLANVLHSATGGSLQGNSPLGLPADVWLAWGWLGVMVIPAIYGFGVGLIDVLLLSNRSGISFAIKIYLFVVLPICYSPFLFLLYGGAVALLLLLLIKILRSPICWQAGSATH